MASRKVLQETGQVISKTFSPSSHAPTFQVRLRCPQGILEVKWLGREAVPGVELGTYLRVSGIPLQEHGQLTLINPDYQLQKAVS